jgi:hypothetical protein
MGRQAVDALQQAEGQAVEGVEGGGEALPSYAVDLDLLAAEAGADTGWRDSPEVAARVARIVSSML